MYELHDNKILQKVDVVRHFLGSVSINRSWFYTPIVIILL